MEQLGEVPNPHFERVNLANSYFESVSFHPEPSQVEDVKKAIELNGRWVEQFEWRISTVRESCIEAAEIHGQRAFKVTVECDFRFECYCPTIERAVHYHQIYCMLVTDLFRNFGWPSWAAKRRLKPAAEESSAS